MDTSAQDPNTIIDPSTPAVANLRTYMSDVAKLIQENQLSDKELAKFDQSFLEAVKRGQIATTIAPKKKSGTLLYKPVPAPQNDALNVNAVEKTAAVARAEQISQLSSYAFATPQDAVKKIPIDATPKPVQPKPVQPKPATSAAAADLLKKYSTPPQPSVKPIVPIPKPMAPVAQKPLTPPQTQAVKPAQPKPVQPQPKLQVDQLIKRVEPIPVKPQPQVQVPDTQEQKLRKQEEQVRGQLTELQLKENQVRDEKLALESQRTSSIMEAEQLKMQEQNAERRENDLLNQKSSATSPQQQATIEKQRWSIEDERQQFEKQRWGIDKKILEFEQRINEVIAKQVDLKRNEEIIQGNLDLIKRQELAIKAQEDRQVFTKKLSEIKSTRTKYEMEWKNLIEKKQKAAEIYSVLEQKEKTLQQQIHTIEDREHSATSAERVHEIEAERWLKDHELRDTEQEKWKEADDLAQIEQQIADLELKTQEVLMLEKQAMRKVTELDQLIKQAEDAYIKR